MVIQETAKMEKLASIIPVILERFEKLDHNIGYSDWEGDEYETNYFCYDEDGWDIEIGYECCGKWDIDPGDYWTPPTNDLVSTWGRVIDLTVSHYDEETDEETEFSADDLSGLRSELELKINSIA